MGGEKPKTNLVANQKLTNAKPSLSLSRGLSTSTPTQDDRSPDDRPPEIAIRGRAREREQDPPNVIPLRPEAAPDKAWHDRTFKTWVASYGKSVSSRVRDIWPDHATSEAAFDRIMAGTLAWRKSRQWTRGGKGMSAEDWVTNPYTFLNDRMYEYPPLPADLDEQEETANGDEKHQGRPGPTGAAGVRAGAGDPGDDFWRSNAGVVTGNARRSPPARRTAD